MIDSIRNFFWTKIFELVRWLVLNDRSTDQVAGFIADTLDILFRNAADYDRYFRLWEQHGFHITPNHFYQPIPDTRTLRDDLWEKESELVGVDLNLDTQLHLLRNIFPQFSEEYNQFPIEPTGVPYEFYFNNPMFSGTDALVLYCMVRYFRPKRIIEVGSGYSTFVSAQAALRNGNTKLICIEPYPTGVLKQGFPGLTELIPSKVEDVDLGLFSQLEENDLLFLDTSHVVRCGGDVNELYLEVIPRLKKGVIVHSHDIFLPKELPKSWILDLHRFWTEQYLLQAFLIYNYVFEVLFSNAYMRLKCLPEMKTTFPLSPWWGGSSFWMRKKV